MILGFDAKLGSSTTVVPATGTDGSVASLVVFDNYASFQYTTNASSPTQTLNIVAYSADNTAHDSTPQTYVSTTYAVSVAASNGCFTGFNNIITATFNQAMGSCQFV